MARSFREVADATAAAWNDDARDLYTAASEYFEFQARAQIELGRQLASLREQNQLSQAALSTLTGVQQAEISRIESGLANPTRDTLLRLGAAFKHKLIFVPEAG